MEQLLDYLESIYPLGDALRQRLAMLIKSKEISKKDYVLRAGQINREIHFIEKGLLWCYSKRDEQDVVSWFMKEGDTIVSVLSFYDQVKSHENIQALEDCELHYISYEELEELYHDFPWFNYIGRVLTIKYLKMFVRQAEGLRGLSAEERYKYMMETQPEIVLRVPTKYMASHLGINEFTLSKIRGKKY
ncbi:MAG: cyclic nucleotide-binding domain-containing protein [Bacteroidota bacterium]|nr:cyclic nucleotide-binding domain-containing protein [Bacteroidota bacterium]MDP4216857.1 cyclic nucleotide-binding domain-containing protein [Bacteroidota bacterium]